MEKVFPNELHENIFRLQINIVFTEKEQKSIVIKVRSSTPRLVDADPKNQVILVPETIDDAHKKHSKTHKHNKGLEWYQDETHVHEGILDRESQNYANFDYAQLVIRSFDHFENSRIMYNNYYESSVEYSIYDQKYAM